jgi:hypothetical protein
MNITYIVNISIHIYNTYIYKYMYVYIYNTYNEGTFINAMLPAACSVRNYRDNTLGLFYTLLPEIPFSHII